VPDPTTAEVVVPGVDGVMNGRLFHLDGGRPRPAILVLPEVDGYCAATEAAAARLAGAGYAAVALDVFAPLGGVPPLTDRDVAMAWVARLDDHRQLSDLAMAVAWLAEQPAADPKRLGILGFSIGGRYAMLLATESHGLGAVVTFYSDPWPGRSHPNVGLGPGDHVPALQAPVCAIYGTEDDFITLEKAQRFGELLEASGHEAHYVAGRHFFANEGRPRRYVRASADAAWAVTLAFFGRHLRPNGG